jgi:parvulin-like peptidyl-prolyl isomerase
LPEQVAGVFGMKFADELFVLKPGAWQGPIESGFGWHLIWIDSLTPGRVPDFEEVEAMVKSEWITEERAEAKRKMFEAMRARYDVKARYDVILPEPPAK